MWPHKKKDNKDECDYSANVCKEMMIVLNNKKRKVVKKIYVVFMTEMEMLMLSFRVDFVYNCKFNVPMLESKEEKDEKMDKVGSGKKSIIKRNVITNRNLSALGNLLGSKSVRKLSVLDKDF